MKINSLIISIIFIMHSFIERARKIIDEIQKKKVEKNLIKKYGKDTHWIRDKRDESMNKLKSHWWWWICICRWLIACIRQLRHEWGKVDVLFFNEIDFFSSLFKYFFKPQNYPLKWTSFVIRSSSFIQERLNI